jgi:hypothetical protein
MTVKLSSLRADIDRETKGDWVEYPDLPGVEFKVSSIHLPAYTTERDMLYQRLQRLHKNKPIPTDTLARELGALFAKHILHDWRGFDIPYSRDTAKEVLSDPAYRDIIAAVQWCAGKISQLDVEFIEDEVKNFEAPTAAA